MSKLDDFAPSPEQQAAAAEALRAEREADKQRVDHARAERLAVQLEAGDEAVPPIARLAAGDLEALQRAGVEPEVLERLLGVGACCGPDERAAIAAAARKRLARPAPSAPRPTARWAIPDLDGDELLRDCPTARAHARVVAWRSLSCEDLPVLGWLAATSAALAAKVRGLTHNNDGTEWRIWTHLYIGAEAPSGASKSLIAEAMLRQHLSGPAGVWTKLRREAEPLVAADEAERSLLRAKRIKLERRAEDNEVEIAGIVERLRQPPIREPRVAELGVSSPEHFVRVCQWTGFRAVIPDEAADWLHKFIGGRENEKVGPLIAGFDGGEAPYSSIAAEQRGDDLVRFPQMHLTLFLLLQENVLSPAAQEEAARLKTVADRGFFPRCLIARPRTLLRAERHALEAEAERLRQEGAETGQAYGRILRSLADLRIGDHPLVPSEPLLVPFTAEATRVRRAYQVKCGDDVAADGPDAGKPGARSIARMHDHAARMAICLACWRCAEEADAAGVELDLRRARVEVRDVERAIRACETYFRPHALAVAGRAILDPVGADADLVLTALQKCPELASGSSLSKREVTRRHFRAGWGKQSSGRNRLNDALEELERRSDVELAAVDKRSVLIRLVVT